MRLRTAVAAVVATGMLAAPAARGTVIDLGTAPGKVRVDGQGLDDNAGLSVANAGDVNGDGKPDFIVGAPMADNDGRADSGSAYVIYGGQSLANVDLEHLGSAGFRIDGAAAGDEAGSSVAGGRDLNGDGIADVVVGAPFVANGNASNFTGSVYVIYGQRNPDPADVDLAEIDGLQGVRGYSINGIQDGERAGHAVAEIGDFNGDGIGDLVVGNLDIGRERIDTAYVVYGRRGDATDLSLADLSTTEAGRGMRIDGATKGDFAGFALDGGEDLNGDGRPDVALGAPLVSDNNREFAGAAYVVYGRSEADPGDVDLSKITTAQAARGLRIDGATTADRAGEGIAEADDLNGDGHPDLIVGAPVASPGGRLAAGAAYVVYGQAAADPADLDLTDITTTESARGFEIVGATSIDLLGVSLAAGGDLNGDGRPDVILGAPGASNESRTGAGSTYVLFGQGAADPPDLDLASIPADPSRGVRIDGPTPGDESGVAVAGGSDLNGDGHPDAIIGSPLDDSSGKVSGSAYVLDLAASPTGATTAATSKPATGAAPDSAAPNTRITKRPRKALRLRPGRHTVKATFLFASTEPGSSFRCKLDKKPFLPCRSPKSYELKRGKHTFSVAATDAAGNRDHSAAAFTVTVAGPDRRPASTR